MEVPEKLVSAAVSDRGLSEHRPQNEDSYLELTDRGLFAVADGVGGTQGGDVASQTAMEILAEAFANAATSDSAEQVIRSAIETANTAIYQMAMDLPQLSSMATTIAVLHIGDGMATIAHVGDSRVYRIDSEGFIHRETQDHSVVEEEVRAGRMTPEQAATHPSRNVISRAVGAEGSVQIDISTFPVDPGSVFLLCSDGVTRHINDNELGELLSTGMSPTLLCEQIKDVCFERGAEDNLTAIVVKTPAMTTESAYSNPRQTKDFEEDTVASTRPPIGWAAGDEESTEPTNIGSSGAELFGFPESAEELQQSSATAETLSADDVAAEDLDNEAYLMEEPPQVEEEQPQAEEESSAGAAGGYTSSRVVVPAVSDDSAQEFSIFGNNSNVQASHEEIAVSSARRMVSSLLILILGGALGFAGYYFYLQIIQVQVPVAESVEPPPLTEMTTRNIPLTTFEESRREVDKDPASYLAKNAATPEDSEDHYLLGRALLLSGKYFEAKRQFSLAIEKLDQSGPENRSTLIVEIAMGNAIIENTSAAESFKKQIGLRTLPVPTNPANVVNSSNTENPAASPANSNRPTR